MLKDGWAVKQKREAMARGQSPDGVEREARKNQMKQASKRRARQRFKENKVNS